MSDHIETTYTVRLYVAGDLGTAKASLRRECLSDGLCVTVTQTTFVYTAGAEDGVEVGFVNYPRFPTTPDALFGRARRVADRLMADLCQWSALLVAPDRTVWINNRPK
jgi:hypothetical protein